MPSHCPAFVLLFAGLVTRLAAWSVEERCETCVDITQAFGEGLRRTRAANFGGGNTAWEERKLGKFATSETRLVDVMEKLCSSARHTKLCHSMVEEQEEFIEAWWTAHIRAAEQKTEEAEMVAADVLHHKLCIARLQVCCPAFHFGDLCTVCPSNCSRHGRCHGNGTRAGDGHCVCDGGYMGRQCQDCRDSHFRSEPGICSACDPACQGCHGSNASSCKACAKGYNEQAGQGCVDVDECAGSTPPCSEREYCENTPGAWMCRACDSACRGCTGSGPTRCRACAPGYQLGTAGDGCVDVNECSADSQLCRGPHRRCRNTVGSFHCECETGYRMEGDTCVKPSARATSGRKSTSAGGKSTDSAKKSKRIWTKRFTREFLKYSAAIGALGLGSYLLKGRVLPVLVMAVGCSAFIFWESVRLDNAFMRKKKL